MPGIQARHLRKVILSIFDFLLLLPCSSLPLETPLLESILESVVNYLIPHLTPPHFIVISSEEENAMNNAQLERGQESAIH